MTNSRAKIILNVGDIVSLFKVSFSGNVAGVEERNMCNVTHFTVIML